MHQRRERGSPHLVARVGAERRPRELGGLCAADLSEGRDRGATDLRRGVSERRRQGHPAGGGEARQRLRGPGPAEIVIGRRGGPGERRAGGRVGGPLGQLLDRPFAVPQVGIPTQLGSEPSRRLIECQLLYGRIPVVEHHHRRRSGEVRDFDRLLAGVELRAPYDVTPRSPDAHRHGHVERSRRLELDPPLRCVGLTGVGLGLLHGQRELPRRGVVGRGDDEPRMARPVHPLLPEPGEVLAGRVEHRLPQVVRRRVPEGMPREIQMNGRPETLRTQVTEQHPED